MIFQCTCQDLPAGGLRSPTVVKNSIIFPPVQSPYHNLITHPFFSFLKNQIVKTMPHPIFLPVPVKTLPQAKFPTPLKCLVSQLLLTLFGWLHEYIFAV